jgi:hypothetical protein
MYPNHKRAMARTFDQLVSRAWRQLDPATALLWTLSLAHVDVTQTPGSSQPIMRLGWGWL